MVALQSILGAKLAKVDMPLQMKTIFEGTNIYIEKNEGAMERRSPNLSLLLSLCKAIEIERACD